MPNCYTNKEEQYSERMWNNDLVEEWSYNDESGISLEKWEEELPFPLKCPNNSIKQPHLQSNANHWSSLINFLHFPLLLPHRHPSFPLAIFGKIHPIVVSHAFKNAPENGAKHTTRSWWSAPLHSSGIFPCARLHWWRFPKHRVRYLISRASPSKGELISIHAWI